MKKDNAANQLVRFMRDQKLGKEPEPLKEADGEFYRLLPIMEESITGREIIWEYFIKHDQFVNSVIFAGYVEMVNVLKNKSRTKRLNGLNGHYPGLSTNFQD